MNWIQLSYKNIYRSKRRTILSIFSVGVVALVMTFQAATVRGIQDDLIRNIKNLKTGDFYIQHKDLEEYKIFNAFSLQVDPKDIQAIKTKYPEATIIESMDFGASLYTDDSEDMKPTHAIAFSMDVQEEKMAKERSIFKIYKNEGRLPKGDREVAIALNMADKYGLKVGSRISLFSQTAERNLNGVTFTVTAIVYFSIGSYNGDTVIFDIPAAQKLLKTPEVTRIMVETGNEKLSKQIMAEFQEQYKNKYIFQGWYDSDDAVMLKIQDVIMKITNLIFFIIGASIIINTCMMNILERRKEIGMMTALGTRVKEVRFLFFLESVWLGLIGTVLGIFIGSIIASILGYTGWDLLGDAISKESGLAISSTLYPRVALGDITEIFLFGVIISAVISYFPTGRVAKITPAEAFRI